jgi:di/tricarboxylate transporter
MSWQMLLLCAVFVSTIAALVFRLASTTRVFGAAFCALFISGFVSSEEVLRSVANEGIVTLVLLLLCSLCLEKTDFLRLLSSQLLKPSFWSTKLRLFFATVLASAFLNNTAVVSSLLAPIRNNPYHHPSRLLILVSYCSILGGTLTLIGTSTNMIVAGLVSDYGLTPLGFFDFTLVGLALVLCCGGVVLCMNTRGQSGSSLESGNDETRPLQHYLIDAKVQANSSLIGKSIEGNGLRHLEALFLVEIVREGRLISPVAPTEMICPNDHLIFNGNVDKLLQLEKVDGLEVFSSDVALENSNLSEVLVRPDSHLLGKTLKQLGFRARFDAAVVALRRDGEPVSGKLGELALQAGDFLVLATGHDFHSRQNLLNNFVFVSGRQPEQVLSRSKSTLSVIGFFVAITLAATGTLDLFQAMLVLFASYLLSGCLSTQEVLRRLPIQLWMIISTALMFSHAAINTGLFEWLSQALQPMLLGLPFMVILAALYLMTWLLTELITNNAAAALMFPFAVASAQAMGIDPMAFVMTITFAASGSFISPYGYQTNLIVFNTGNYQFADFARNGWPVALVYGVVVILTVPLVWA